MRLTLTIFSAKYLGASVADRPVKQLFQRQRQGHGAGPAVARADDAEAARRIGGDRRNAAHCAVGAFAALLALACLHLVPFPASTETEILCGKTRSSFATLTLLPMKASFI